MTDFCSVCGKIVEDGAMLCPECDVEMDEMNDQYVINMSVETIALNQVAENLRTLNELLPKLQEVAQRLIDGLEKAGTNVVSVDQGGYTIVMSNDLEPIDIDGLFMRKRHDDELSED